MNHATWNRTGPVLLATGLAAALLVAVLWLAAPPHVTLAESTAALVVEKWVAPEYAQPGEVVTYTITLSNSDPISSVNATVHDPLHALLSYVPDSASGAPVAGEGLTWTVTVSPATEVALHFQALVDEAATDGTVITNTATVSSEGSAVEASAALAVDMPPFTQIRSPNKDAFVAGQDMLEISGYAWDHGVTPAFLVEDARLNVQRVDERSYFVGWTEVVSAEQYLLHESTTPDFEQVESQSITAPTTNLLVDKGSGEDGTYYYRVQALKFGVESSRWSNVVSLKVPWLEGTLAMPVASPALGVSSEPLTVEVQIDSGGWETTTATAQTWGGWRWSYAWELPQEQDTQHVIHSRALDQAGNVSAVDSITVTLNTRSYKAYLPFIMLRWPPVPYAPVLNPIDNGDEDGNYTVRWSYDAGSPLTAVSRFTLHEDTDPEFGAPEAYTTTKTSQVMSGKLPGVYYYRVRGNNSYGTGPWSEVQTASVLPGVPVLNAIDNPSNASSYTVSWSAVAAAESYQLEEATSSDFGNATLVYDGPDLSFQATNKNSGTYYYRVRAVAGSVFGEWSNTVSTEALGDFYDDFTNPDAGWITYSAKSGLTDCDNAREHLEYKYNLYYDGGRYKVHVPLDCRAGGVHGDTRHIYPVTFAPGVQRPETETCVGMQGSFEQNDPYWSFYGVVFAASDDKGTVYSLEVNDLGDWAIIKRTNYKFPGPNHPFLNEIRQNVERDTGYVGGLQWPARPAFKTNKLEVEIRSNALVFYINDVKIYTVNDAYIVNEVRSLKNVGIIGGNWEITPTTIGYDYFYMDVGCDNY